MAKTKVGYRRAIKGHITLLHAVDTIRRIREDKKYGWDDVPKVVSFVIGEALLWGPDLLDWKKASLKPLYIIDGLIIAGGIVSYGIGGEQGVYDFVDVITGEVTPAKYYSVVVPQVKKKITREVTRLEAFTNFLGYIVERQLKRSGFRTGPYSPF